MHGKTTILRDIIRSISTGMEEIHFKGMNIGLVDERGEIAALYKGIPQNDIGVRTDVLENTPKSIGIKRSKSCSLCLSISRCSCLTKYNIQSGHSEDLLPYFSLQSLQMESLRRIVEPQAQYRF